MTRSLVINNTPDVYQLHFVSNVTQDKDLESVEIPEAHRLEITVFDPDGQPLEGIATWVRSVDESANARYGWFTSTETGGIYQFAPDRESGIEVGGKVEIAVEPENPERNADDPRVPDEPVTQELVVDSDTSVDLYLITVRTYTNDNDIITVSGVSDAISDWQAGRIGVGLVSEVISAWQSGAPVT